MSCRLDRATRMRRISISEWNAATEQEIGLRYLFRNEAWAWKKVSAALALRQANRESVGLGRERRRFDQHGTEPAAEKLARDKLLTAANRPARDALEKQRAESVATNALLRAVLAAEKANTSQAAA